jgi:two-component system sensor histidine kinase UhpB
MQTELERELPRLADHEELVIYRVAQEALTNVARHAGAATAALSLVERSGSLVLRVKDDGVGVGGAAEGTGVRGMRERAVLIGAELSWADREDGQGGEVVLELPLDGRG